MEASEGGRNVLVEWRGRTQGRTQLFGQQQWLQDRGADTCARQQVRGEIPASATGEVWLWTRAPARPQGATPWPWLLTQDTSAFLQTQQF